MRSLVLALLTLTLSLPAFAADGVLEINQTCAVQTGCFPGDGAGFPVTITSPGSYGLTSNLENLTSPTNHISIMSSSVTLDLHGFEVSGPRDCSGLPPTCSGAASGLGIRVDVPAARFNVAVRNGSVRGTTGFGIMLGNRSVVEKVRIDDIAGTGVSVGAFGTVQDATVISTSDHGMSLGELSRAVDNLVVAVRLDGIVCGDGCVVRGNVAARAPVSFASAAIRVGANGQVQDNTASDSDKGIVVGPGSNVSGNTINGNVRGLEVGIGSNVTRNVFQGNSTAALRCEPGEFSTYVNNTFTVNAGTSATVDGPQGIATICQELGTNFCGTDTGCP